MWESRSRTTSCPGCVCVTTETRLPMVPDVTKSPAAFPIRSAASASSRLTVGSSSHTSSPTSARAMASRMAGVGSVSVSERRSTMSCTGSPLGLLETLAGPTPPFSERILGSQPPEQFRGLGRSSFAESDVGEHPERLRNDQGPWKFLERVLQALPGGGRVALVVVVGGDPDLLLGKTAAADVDLGQRVAGVPTLGIILDQLLELLEGFQGQRLVLLHRLHLVVVAHGHPELDEVGDLMARIEGQEDLELLDGLFEVTLAVVRLADQEPGARRVAGVRVALDDLLELRSGLLVALPAQFLHALLVQLFGR